MSKSGNTGNAGGSPLSGKPDKPTITKPLEAQVNRQVGDELTLTVEATGEHLAYKWTRDGVPLEGGDASYGLAKVEKSDAGTYKVEVAATKDGKTSEPVASVAEVTVADKDAKSDASGGGGGSESPPLAWDAKFGANVLKSSLWTAVVLTLVIIALAFWLGDDLPRLVVTGLFLLSGLLVIAGAAMALIDLRGRARVVEAATSTSKGGRGIDELVKQAPELISRFGSLGLPSAVLLVALTAIIGATAIGWRSLPDPLPVKPTPSASASPDPSASSPGPSASPTSFESPSSVPSPAPSHS